MLERWLQVKLAMDTKKAIHILEALASGCSPSTGETINDDSVLNERDVIRALQIAISELKALYPATQSSIHIDEGDIKRAIELFRDQDKNPGAYNLVAFFLGTRKFKNDILLSHELYGKYKTVYSKGQLIDYLNQFLIDKDLLPKSILNSNPYPEIDFFRKPKFNTLSNNAIAQLKEKVNELGILKTENLTEYILNARKNHPRAYESWSETELDLLRKAMKYTNDLNILSDCFQRGKGSIESCGVKLIHDENLADDQK